MKILALAGLIAVSALITGCLVSGTFIIVEDFEFTGQTGYYQYSVDLTDESDWEDHKDDIDMIDAVGFEFTITNNSDVATVFNAWVTPADTNYNSVAEIIAPGNSTKVITDLAVPALGTISVNYAQSLGHITNLAALKALVKTGKFEFYGTSTNNPDVNFDVTNGKVIITFSASGS
jgi:hypothetical protein